MIFSSHKCFCLTLKSSKKYAHIFIHLHPGPSYYYKFNLYTVYHHRFLFDLLSLRRFSWNFWHICISDDSPKLYKIFDDHFPRFCTLFLIDLCFVCIFVKILLSRVQIIVQISLPDKHCLVDHLLPINTSRRHSKLFYSGILDHQQDE